MKESCIYGIGITYCVIKNKRVVIRSRILIRTKYMKIEDNVLFTKRKENIIGGSPL